MDTGPLNIVTPSPSEAEIQRLIAERKPSPKPECEKCLFEFSPRRCFNCTKQGGTGESYWIPFSGWEDDLDVRGGHDCDHEGLVVDGVCGACHEKVEED